MRSCDNCRRRKIKCDFGSPQCSSCHLSTLSCAYTVPPKKRGRRFRTPASNSDFLTSSLPSSSLTTVSPSWPNMPLDNFPTPTTSPASLPSSHTTSHVPGDSIQHQFYEDRHEVDTPSGFRFQLLGVYKDLASAVYKVQPQVSLELTVSECIDLFLQYLFPIMPLVHERSLRASLALFTSDSEICRPACSSNQPYSPEESIASRNSIRDLALCRNFSLTTAVCAQTCLVLPSQLFPRGSVLANHFLGASRRALSLQHDEDIETPSSQSIIIRYLHSNAVHAAGKTQVSWHLLGEAIRISQAMCIHRESALEKLSVVEAQLSRNIFWQLHTGDRSAALLNNRPFILHEFSIRDHISVQHAPPDGVYMLLDLNRSNNSEPYESRIMQSFHLCQRLWDLAARLLLNFQLLEPFCASPTEAPKLTEEQALAVVEAYVQFLSFTDDIPSWLQNIEISNDMSNKNEKYQQSAFWIQRINLQVTFQSLSLIILQRFVDLNLLSLLGLSSEPLMVALKKTEIAREMLLAIQNVPFEFLQINGESCVEKIRQVGASLLEITQTIKNDRITKRALLELPNLLNILARLNSRASDLKDNVA